MMGGGDCILLGKINMTHREVWCCYTGKHSYQEGDGGGQPELNPQIKSQTPGHSPEYIQHSSSKQHHGYYRALQPADGGGGSGGRGPGGGVVHEPRLPLHQPVLTGGEGGEAGLRLHLSGRSTKGR